jgi:hypothetical protein
MSYLSETFAALFARLGLEKYVIPVAETPTGDAKNLQANADGHLLVDLGGLDESVLATSAKQDTGNASLTSIDGKVATSAKQDTAIAALTTLHADVDGVETMLGAIAGQLPTTLGAKTSAASLAVTLSSDEPSIDVTLAGIAALATEASLASLLSEVRELATETALATLGSEIKFRQEAGNSHLNDISGKLPATLGAKTASASLSVTPATDAVFGIEAPENAYQTVRTWAASVADSEPAVEGSNWVALTGANKAGYVVQHYAITAVGGTVAPSQVIFRTWIRVGGAGGTIQKIDEWTADASWLVTAAAVNPYWRRIIPVNCDDIFVTATFPDGASPTITGTVSCRAVAHAGLQRRDLTYDPATGLPVVQSKSYDAATGTDKTSPSYQQCDLYLNEPLAVNEATKANGDYYGPSDAGLIVGEHGEISVSFSVTGANNGTVTITVEATNQESWASPIDITKSVWESKAGALISAGSIATAANGTQTGILCLGNGSSPCNYRMIRVKYVVADGASGAISMSFRRKVRS